MGKISKGSLVSPRRRLVKASGSGGKKSRAASKVTLPPPPPPPPQSLVLDEDSGFGGDQSLDSSESSLLSSPSVAGQGVVLPPLTMVPQTKLLLVSLLQGAGGLPGLGTSQNASANIAVGAFPPTTQASVSNGTNQTGNTHGAVMSRGAEKEGQSSYSVRPLLAAAPTELPAASTSSPSNYPTEPVALGSTGHKVVESHLDLKGTSLQVDLSGEEAQELPASLTTTTASTTATHTVPPLVSFRDVSLLSSLHQFKGSGNSNPSVLRVEGGTQPCSGRGSKVMRSSAPHTPPPLTAQLSARSSDGSVELKLVSQPEEQHRARYQTEGSRGAVKDRSGTGHPTVKLVGYNKPTTIQVFVGSDTGKSGPHMFYQVCRVSGKNSTPCRERRLDGTVVIEASLNPDSNMTMSCDCVGILKERNVDVEHRFKAVMSRGRKKSTKCRLVFRTFINQPSGAQEVLQVVSQPIACTQPPGVPEICRKSISSSSVAGGEEMFIFGKNFLKDTVVVFQQTGAKSQPIWEEKVLPDKDSLQPIHLIVMVPRYYDASVSEEVKVEMMVMSGGKKSEPQTFTYLPLLTKKEMQMSDTWEDKPLPKGVSPSALQLNRHYAETGTLPQHLPETAPHPNLSPSLAKSSPASTPTPVVTSPVRTSRVMLNSAKKIVGRASRLASRGPRTNPLTGRTIHTGVIDPPSTAITPAIVQAPVQAPVQADVPAPALGLEGPKPQEMEKQVKVPAVQGTVTLESLVEMLKVVQKFPAGSNLYTSVLQLVEKLIRSMKDSIQPQFKTEVEEEFVEQQQPTTITPSQAVVTSSLPASSPQGGPFLINKGQKLVPGLVASQPQVPLATNSPTTNMAIPMATPVSLFPFTVFSAMPSTVSANPKVARVAPVAPVAPTTVVSSPGLTRAVRVCVAETPNLVEEPPLKKQREDTALPLDYNLVRQGQFTSGPLVACSMASTEAVPPPNTSPTFTAVASLLPQKVVEQCSQQEVLSETTPAADSLRDQLRLTGSQEVLGGPAVLRPQQLANPPVTSPPQGVFQPLSQSVLQNMEQTPQQHQEQPATASQPTTMAVTQAASLATLSQQARTITQQLTTMPERQMVEQHSSQQAMDVQPNLPVSVSDPLLSQGPGMCDVLSSTTRVTPVSTQEASTCVTSSALTHSDPLLSQSSPIQMDTNAAMTAGRNEGGAGRARADGLMASNPTTTQVSMQNEVTSAINLSETELLNYFDPNCFDNV